MVGVKANAVPRSPPEVAVRASLPIKDSRGNFLWLAVKLNESSSIWFRTCHLK